MAAGKRTIGLAMDYSPSSKAAMRWVVENLVKAGDRIILIHVLPKGADASHKGLWKSTGSRMSQDTESSVLFCCVAHSTLFCFAKIATDTVVCGFTCN
uniref:UspA domain-containing protein n=1 Tax=Aegilops tauschii subsp. strangulata TaxID=200361 RepID=A0A453PP82_AEGTS